MWRQVELLEQTPLDIAVPIAVERAGEGDHLSDRHVSVGLLVFGNVSHAPPALAALPGIVNGASKHNARPACRPADSQKHLDRAALARAVAAEESGDAARAD